ncbi:hypothetical protein ANN_15211 [Periplaneta americana]|uniref:Uncharacterized protein n=1 Tax=Periplaneta americana TaxID=6978 RepID=A0ABQ8SFR8_PERAM|nr:hypothetical protein ANN_15211 [Periplaneta americana]
MRARALSKYNNWIALVTNILESGEELFRPTFQTKKCCSVEIEAPAEAEEPCGVEKKKTESETSCQSSSQPRDTAAPDTFTKQNVIFSDNPVLEAVSLKGNPLVYVPEALPILESSSVLSLDLSFCTLTALNSFTFLELPNLQNLDLNSNHLRDIQLEDLDYLTELTVLDLGNNLWNCDCSLMYVLNWFSERRRSQELEGDHRPVKCLEAGIYKTWWTSAKEVRPCDTKKTRNLVETFYTERAEMSETQDIATSGLVYVD